MIAAAAVVAGCGCSEYILLKVPGALQRSRGWLSGKSNRSPPAGTDTNRIKTDTVLTDKLCHSGSMLVVVCTACCCDQVQLLLQRSLHHPYSAAAALAAGMCSPNSCSIASLLQSSTFLVESAIATPRRQSMLQLLTRAHICSVTGYIDCSTPSLLTFGNLRDPHLSSFSSARHLSALLGSRRGSRRLLSPQRSAQHGAASAPQTLGMYASSLLKPATVSWLTLSKRFASWSSNTSSPLRWLPPAVAWLVRSKLR